jgi:hypothetical protein
MRLTNQKENKKQNKTKQNKKEQGNVLWQVIRNGVVFVEKEWLEGVEQEIAFTKS